MQVKPYSQKESKKEEVRDMFNNIAGTYDQLNHLLSLGIDIKWRNRAVKILKANSPSTLLDVATGTGDFAISALKTGAKSITGIDISENMLEIGKEKVKKIGMEKVIELKVADCENLPFDDNSFDAIIVSFGVRNFENLEKGLKEMFRVVKSGGLVLILEFSKPSGFPFKQIYNLYFKMILPTVGRIISKDKSAYTYLPASVDAFPDGKNFLDIMSKQGFSNLKQEKLTFGISSIYTGSKL